MRRGVPRGAIAAACAVAGIGAWAQATVPVPAPTSGFVVPARNTPDAPSAVSGGRLHGQVKSGTVPLPGVTVTAQNTLTGKLFDNDGHDRRVVDDHSAERTVRDSNAICGVCAGIPRSGVECFEPRSSGRFSTDACIASGPAGASEDAQAGQVTQAIRQLAGNGAQALSLLSALTGDTEKPGGATGTSGAALPSIAGNSDFSDQSVAISGQSG